MKRAIIDRKGTQLFRGSLLALIVLLVALVPAPATVRAEGRDADQETWFASALTSGPNGSVMIHYWSRGARMRAETVISGHRIITLVSEAHYTVIDELSGHGTVIERSKNATRADAKRGRPFATELSDLRSMGGEFVRKEEVGGRTLDVYRVTNDRGRRTVWVDPGASEVPVRVEAFDRRTAATRRIDYVGWMKGMPIPSRFFDPASNIELKRLSYEQFATLSASKDGQSVGPVFYGDLLHGERPD